MDTELNIQNTVSVPQNEFLTNHMLHSEFQKHKKCPNPMMKIQRNDVVHGLPIRVTVKLHSNIELVTNQV